MAEGTLIRFIAEKVRARGLVLDATGIAEEAARIHGLDGELKALFGEVLAAAVLLTAHTKGGVRQVVQLDAEREEAPVRRMLAEAGQGAVRGYLHRTEAAPLPGERLERWMGLPVRLAVVRDMGFGHPYLSVVEQTSPWVADGVAEYLWRSVQTRAEVILTGARGLLLEAMPGADAAHWRKALQAVAEIPTAEIARASPQALVARLERIGARVLAEETWRYRCRCTLDSVARALEQLDANALRELIDDSGMITVSCEYCGKQYRIPAPKKDA